MAPTTDAKERTCPYPGLRPFGKDEAVFFFGRDEQVDQLLERLGSRRFLAVVGTSGCGKTSLVHAGLIPALRTGLMGPAAARWAVATMRPGDRPLWHLAEALLDPTVLGPAWSGLDDPTAQVHAALRRGPLGLAEVLNGTPLPDGRKLLLLVDQFEELFRYRRLGERQRDEANAFVALLLATARETDRPVYIVLTMRSEYLGDCAVFDGLPEALNESQFLTPKLTRAQRRQAIEGPARVLDGRVEPALVTRLLNDMGPGPDRLPLMQHALMRLWKGSAKDSEGVVELTLATYEDLGGLEGALSGQADAAYQSLDPGQQRIAEVLFRRLCERTAAGRDIRRPTPLGEVARVAEVTREAVLAVVDVFRDPDRCFLMPPLPVEIGPDDVLDISHESLIRHWVRLRDWVDEEARSAEVYRRLDQTARLWSEGRAGLWGSPDLDLALRWKGQARPNAAWADRYGGDLDRALRFLDASVEERDRKQAEEQRRRRAEEAEAAARRMKTLSQRFFTAAAACLVLTVAIVFLTGLIRSLNAQNKELNADISGLRAENHSLTVRLGELDRLVKNLGLPDWAELADPRAFSVVEPGRDQIAVKGRINPTYIREVRVHWGTEDGTKSTPLYEGRDQPDLSRPAAQVEFSGQSPKLRLRGEPIVATLEFIPYEELRLRFPQYFPPDKLQYSRTFLLGRDGVIPDPVLLEVEDLKDGTLVKQQEEFRGRLNMKAGWPVVFVKPLTGGSNEQWWPQPPVAEVSEGGFTALANFGDGGTSPGTAFRIVVVAARNQDEALRFRAGVPLVALPPNLPRSKPITVTRE